MGLEREACAPWKAEMRRGGIDASNAQASVALFEGDNLLIEREGGSHREASEWLLPLLNDACYQLRWSPQDIQQWVVCIGPGSFTGVRAAASLIKGIALVTGAVVCAVTSFEAEMFSFQPEQEEMLAVVLPASPGELFLQVNRGRETVIEPVALQQKECALFLKPFVNGPLVILEQEGGSGIDWSPLAACSSVRWERLGKGSRAKKVGLAVRNQRPIPIDALEPFYIKPPLITQPKKIV
ncbi:tRNA (adenosine(37)-N6)-threonylcarbamoyltransferase complex dimerization subunit type 1 TsaB [Pajaroellobacter abortibovis]|uniref:tRNA N6-adenosine(37)-N6-threonylcarbamoyltransferase complex dimerization subunit TsaB n=1 Tax=Pajaroellobacter abortibovis TaxID=1882918 RepID=A0A1L6MWU3_9BACT|nr:tRNA (adenosine(37)-N6)-threonylcarbamoyltransferase complex dimerization subunit type 1 TsaB [Pajaroellobacter abortibovis]APR99905.1 tRNA N6-adenosine(37)-N6-threonylcarbamoyltransferase complex dimerization subunit TsaB [Pajaroellobacter abortibovis]